MTVIESLARGHEWGSVWGACPKSQSLTSQKKTSGESGVALLRVGRYTANGGANAVAGCWPTPEEHIPSGSDRVRVGLFATVIPHTRRYNRRWVYATRSLFSLIIRSLVRLRLAESEGFGALIRNGKTSGSHRRCKLWPDKQTQLLRQIARDGEVILVKASLHEIAGVPSGNDLTVALQNERADE